MVKRNNTETVEVIDEFGEKKATHMADFFNKNKSNLQDMIQAERIKAVPKEDYSQTADDDPLDDEIQDAGEHFGLAPREIDPALEDLAREVIYQIEDLKGSLCSAISGKDAENYTKHIVWSNGQQIGCEPPRIYLRNMALICEKYAFSLSAEIVVIFFLLISVLPSGAKAFKDAKKEEES